MKKTTHTRALSRQERRATLALKRIGAVIKENGLTLEAMIERGREIRAQLIAEEYPNVASLVGAAGTATKKMEWDEVLSQARAERLQKKYGTRQ